MANAELNVILSADGKQLASTTQQAVKDVATLDAQLEDLKHSAADVDKSLNKTSATLKKSSQSATVLTKNIKQSEQAIKRIPAVSNNATQSLVNLGRVAQDAPFGIIGIANNINPLIESFQRLKQSAGTTGAALKGLAASLLGGGGLGFAVSVITGLMSFLALRSRGATDEIKETNKTVDEAAEKQKEFSQAVDKAASSVLQQAAELTDLRAILISTKQASVELTESTIKQGLARFIFDEKNVELQKIIAAQIQKQIILRKRLIGVSGLPEFKTDEQTEGLRRFNDQLEKVGTFDINLRKDIKQLDELNKTITESGGEINFLNALGPDLNNFFKSFLDTKKAKEGTDDIIAQARRLAEFFDKRSIREIEFELDPQLSDAEQKKFAREFIDKLIGPLEKQDRGLFHLEPQVFVDSIDFQKTEKYFQSQRANASKLLSDLQEEINKLTKNNAILIRAERVQLEEKARGAELADSLGLNLEGVNRPLSLLTKVQKEAINAANTINKVLSPAFGDLFGAIQKGENPIKAFFEGLRQAVSQLIQQLIQAAIQALIIQAIFPGLGGGKGGFGKIFKSLLGFRAEGGPVFANRPYVVGEQGPELFIPQGGGRIVPNNELNSGLASVQPGALQIEVFGQLSGKDIRLSGARQGRYNQRNV